ncbi:hypothetical protein SAY86_005370 [Trapa natans]|uniref:BHLH domain-containing protein n=1 Tax=Trapa natans TaxID=22666 RepID=A0AAN7KZW1_TRANT|nr:hypothetical protein SAY86_005370 [Trapa natans]
MSRDLKLTSRLLQASGAFSYYHDLDNKGGDMGRGSTTQQAFSDISSSPSHGSLSYDDDHEANNSTKTIAKNIPDCVDRRNDFLSRISINHGDIGFQSHSLIDFKSLGSYVNGKGSLMSFEQNHHQMRIHQPSSIDDSFVWKHDGDDIMSGYVDYNSRQATNPGSDPKGCSKSPHIPDKIINHDNYYQQGGGSNPCGWLCSDSTVVDGAQPSKKQCTAVAKSLSSKPNKAVSMKDPQSIAAKNRRERISERLKVLQELVPNGPKVDLVTMLDKAISYVKFLQLQVKVLATDEFWPAQGGKAPDISQVKEAIDAILASQRKRSSSSK